MSRHIRRYLTTALALTLAAAGAVVAPGAAQRASALTTAAPSDVRLAAEPTRHKLTREQFYFVLPDRFANGSTTNDRGGLSGDRLSTGFDPTDKGFYQGGDLKGLTQKLDYIKGLGTTAIWMAPIFKNKPVQGQGNDISAGYHGYWITDFTQVDPHFGTKKDLATLIRKAHAKGMKVFFDVMVNHTADTMSYVEEQHPYRSKGAYPYLDRQGRPFDDTVGVPADGVDEKGLPYAPKSDGTVRAPAWLNDPTMYHNRGDSTYSGESVEYGDLVSLDDLWTERPEVVNGMKKIYESWVHDFDVDGFRIDAVKHTDMAFWTQWATALDAYAKRQGRDKFFLFGESYTNDARGIAPYVTQGRLDSMLDFPFQIGARTFASAGGPAQDLADVYATDYRYSSDKSDPYELTTFLGNHDMGRIGTFIRQDNPKADDAEMTRRARLAYASMFLGRGNPVIYYGDEQGFTGAGGDKDARQTMFASKVPDYLDDDEIGTTRTHARDSYDPNHPLYRAIAQLSALTRKHPALRDGVQTERYVANGPGVYAYSRTDPRERVEYVVLLNNATEAKQAELTTESAGMTFRTIYGGHGTVRSGADAKISVQVPPLSATVLRADRPLGVPAGKPSITLKAPAAGATGTVEVSAQVSGGGLNRVVFAGQTGDGKWQVLGSADHAPYKVVQHLSDKLAAGTPLRYKAVVVDSAGRTAHALADSTTGVVAGTGKPAVDRDYGVVHYQRPDKDYDGWQVRTADGTAPFSGRDAYGAFAWVKLQPGRTKTDFSLEKNGTADGATRTVDFAHAGEVWLEQGQDTVLTEAPEGARAPQDPKKVTLHYHRTDGDYDGWGMHVWGGAAYPTDWAKPLMPVSRDPFGVTFEVPLVDGTNSLSFILHKDNAKNLPYDQSLDFRTYGREVWLLEGESDYLVPSVSAVGDLDLSKRGARWIGDDTVVWNVKTRASQSQQLVYAPKGGITVKDGALSDEGHWLRLVPTTLTDEQKSKYPDLAGVPAFKVDPRDRDRVGAALAADQLIATQRAVNGALLEATGVDAR